MATPKATISTILGPDILWSIFSMNADMFTVPQPRPLETARHTSQVCRLWRDLMIGTPTLWGNILDLRDLQGKRNRWRDEVMKRTGKALLNIKGLITGPPMFRVLQGWLDTNWERIRILDVWALDPGLFNQAEWRAIVKSAPSLVSFRVDPCPVYMMDRAEELFGRKADSLTTISINFRTKPLSWVRNLRDVTFCAPFNIFTVLDMLPHIPCIESLALQDMVIDVWNEGFDDIPDGKPPIVLPHLTRISLGERIGSFNEITYLLQQIIPADNCTLKVLGLRLILESSSISGFDDLISRYARNTFSTRHAQSIGINAWNNECIIDVRHNTDIIHDTRIESSSFYLRMGWQLRQEKIVIDAIRPFFSDQISSITTFDFILEDHFFGQPQIQVSQLQEIIHNLPLVERLRASEPALRFLLNNSDPQNPTVSSNSNTIFPQLTELRIVGNFSDIHRYMITIEKFLSVRSANHEPIRVLDITEYAQRRRNWDFLDGFKGLKVVCEIRGVYFDYICGSGDPRKLDL